MQERRLALALLTGDDEDWRRPAVHPERPPGMRVGERLTGMSRPGSGETFAPGYMDIHLRCLYKIVLLNMFV